MAEKLPLTFYKERDATWNFVVVSNGRTRAGNKHGSLGCFCSGCSQPIPVGEVCFNRPSGSQQNWDSFRHLKCVTARALVGGGQAGSKLDPAWPEKIQFGPAVSAPAEQAKAVQAIKDSLVEIERVKAETKQKKRDDLKAERAKRIKVATTGDDTGVLSQALSVEVLVLICSQLSTLKRLTCSTAVCKSWRALRQQPEMWRSMEFELNRVEYTNQEVGKQPVKTRSGFWPSAKGFQRLVKIVPKSTVKSLHFSLGQGTNESNKFVKRVITTARNLGGGVIDLQLQIKQLYSDGSELFELSRGLVEIEGKTGFLSKLHNLLIEENFGMVKALMADPFSSHPFAVLLDAATSLKQLTIKVVCTPSYYMSENERAALSTKKNEQGEELMQRIRDHMSAGGRQLPTIRILVECPEPQESIFK